MSLTRLMRLVLLHAFVVIFAESLATAVMAQQDQSSMAAAATAKGQPSIVHKITSPNERIEITVNTSRILTLDQKIPQAQVNNPELLDLHPLSPNEIQLFAKKPGVTQVNLWGANQQVYTIDVVVYGDAQALTVTLQTLFPNSSLKVLPVANGVVLSGYVDQPENVSRIMEIAQEFYPKVLNNMRIAGAQQVMLHIKVMEVSRTKLRQLGFDFVKFSNGAPTAFTGITGIISDVTTTPVLFDTTKSTAGFLINNGPEGFFGVLNAMRKDNLVKVLSEPDLVTVSGRPASFIVGGELPTVIPQSLGTVTVEYKKYGTQVDFVPIVLGNGRIRLEVRPKISDVDPTRGIDANGMSVPALSVREVETGVEMSAGQTLAIAGLVQTRTDAENKGLPFLSELPYIGAVFRQVQETKNEIELLVLVTPEFAAARDSQEMPICGPGMHTTSPSDCELYLKGHLEVPNCGPSGCSPQRPTNDQTTSMPSCTDPSCAGPSAGMPGPGMNGPLPVEALPPLMPPRIEGNATPQPMPITQSMPTQQPLLPSNFSTMGRNAGMTLDTSSIPQNRYTPPMMNQNPAYSNAQRANEPNFIGPMGYEVR